MFDGAIVITIGHHNIVVVVYDDESKQFRHNGSLLILSCTNTIAAAGYYREVLTHISIPYPTNNDEHLEPCASSYGATEHVGVTGANKTN